jgi:hypothetical protein
MCTSRTGSGHGAITFDYRMKHGPVTRSNALALMGAVGLEIATPCNFASYVRRSIRWPCCQQPQQLLLAHPLTAARA